jgi:predicted DCC family thiol-disulfide oxidoreductase YuxK
LDFTITNNRTILQTIECVYGALDSELRNVTSWSRPFIKIKSDKPTEPLRKGQLLWLYIGLVNFPKMQMKITKLVPPKQIVVEYINGDFVGDGVFQLMSRQGTTDVVFSWRTRVNTRSMNILSRLLPIKKIHFMVVSGVLRKLEHYIVNETMSISKNNQPPHLETGDRVILFDGVCKLCNAWGNFIIQYDKTYKFKLASVQSTEGQEILAHFGYPLDVFETMLVVDGDRCFEKSDAFFHVMTTLGFPWRTISILQFAPRVIRDWAYDRIALNRYKLFGKYNYCNLPHPDHERRYLDGSSAS